MILQALDQPGLRLTVAELMALRPPARMQRQRPASRRPGAIPARVAGQGMDLREIRAFTEGDDLRRIDPAATARTGQLHVRSFHEDRDDSTLLIADFRHAMLWGTGAALRSVRAARHLAMLGWRAVGRGGSVGVLVVGDDAPLALNAASGAAQMQAIAVAMARGHDAALMRRRAVATLVPALAQAVRMVPPGGRVHLATGPEGLTGADAALTRLAQGRRLEVHVLLDPAEIAPPAAALAVSDGTHSRHGRLSAFDPQPLLSHLRILGAHPDLVSGDDAG
ncbi:DUF58 domain-containing protein [Paracoccus laeviglucosivorans]|uniref:DUF58 domain-containing protein n=1 Tax=Paracoccus laeviglucosivorans TaxID=1197861 RepID=UPI001FE6697F|nr:DUF58 domain-containing protein [Paracoccus laeviglucosivorans]